MLPSPRDSLAFLTNNFKDVMKKCATMGSSHRYECIETGVQTVDCSSSANVYPLVDRKPGVGGGCNETLVLNSIVISWVLIKEENC